jgi:GTPase
LPLAATRAALCVQGTVVAGTVKRGIITPNMTLLLGA